MDENDKLVHLAHCNMGDYVGSCKYGDEDCPCLSVKGMIPEAIAQQACTITKTGSTVTIKCDNSLYANQLFDWLTEL